MARVLLADSQPLFNEALEALFARSGGHDVVGRGASAEETLSIVRRLRPDLVLVDAGLGLDGSPTLVTRILEACPETRVVVLGDDRDAGLLLSAIRAGAAGVVGKTHGASTVLRVAAAVLAGEAAVPRAMLLEVSRRRPSRCSGRWSCRPTPPVGPNEANQPPTARGANPIGDEGGHPGGLGWC